MFKKKDPYSFSKFCGLLNAGNRIGSIYSEYQVSAYDDVQLQNADSMAKKNKKRKFLVHCSQTVNIYNPDGINLNPGKDDSSYNNYPALINTYIQLTQSKDLDFQLLQYSPRTVNTKVQQSGSSGSSDGKTSGTSTSSTVGSSTSQTNSYGASVSVGLTEMSDSASFNYEHSTTSTNEHSLTTGSDSSSSRSSDISSSAEMSIKDWGSYSLVEPGTQTPRWTFGQEYPWDAIECRKTTGTVLGQQTQIIIPSGVALRLYDGVSLYPPSQLSMFGVNFVMKALWLVTIDNEEQGGDELTITHFINYWAASHMLADGPSVSVYLDQQPTALQVENDESLDTSIDLSLLALDPAGSKSRGAIVGFVPNKFIITPLPASPSASDLAGPFDSQASFSLASSLPSPAGSASSVTPPVPFSIISGTNDLLIRDTTAYPSNCDAGAGFTASETSLTANFSANCPSLQMTMYFKVTDTVNEYRLFMKHWKTGSAGVMLTLIINGDTDNPITKYIDALEAEGGENNLTAIDLRNQDYAMIDYHDYLQLGLNSVQITIQPMDMQSIAGCGYQIRAVSIEKA